MNTNTNQNEWLRRYNYYIQRNETAPHYAVVDATLTDGTILFGCAIRFDTFDELLCRKDLRIDDVLAFYRDYGRRLKYNHIEIYDND